MYKRFPFPKQYWVYLVLVIIFGTLLIGNVYRTDSWTGDKPFSEFLEYDWHLFFIFLIQEIIIITLMFVFTFLAYRTNKKRNIIIQEQWEKVKYSGIKLGDYDYVWFDFSNSERALILKQGNQFKLYVQEFDELTWNWGCIDATSVYNSLEEVKKALYFECDFYCEENAELDKHGDEIYKET